jgi:1-aminocyclopropane-1-carboxylate synthase
MFLLESSELRYLTTCCILCLINLTFVVKRERESISYDRTVSYIELECDKREKLGPPPKKPPPKFQFSIFSCGRSDDEVSRLMTTHSTFFNAFLPHNKKKPPKQMLMIQEEGTVMKRILAWLASAAASSSSSARKMTTTATTSTGGFAHDSGRRPSRTLVSMMQNKQMATSTSAGAASTTTTTTTTTILAAAPGLVPFSRSYSSTVITASSGGGGGGGGGGGSAWLSSRSGGTTKTTTRLESHPPSTTSSCASSHEERRKQSTSSSSSSTSASPNTTTNTSTITALPRNATSTLSSRRGRNAVRLLPTYLADARSVEKYCATHRPHGALQLGVAESQMLEDWLVPALNNHQHTWNSGGDDDDGSSRGEDISTDIPADAIYYQPTPGRPGLRMAMAQYMEDVLDLTPGRLHKNEKALEGIVVGAGCNAVLENLCLCLADPGQAVLIPTPYYAAFEFDLAARAQLHVQPVPTRAFRRPHSSCSSISSSNASKDNGGGGGGGIDPCVYYPTVAALDAAYDAAQAAGHEARILLLSHPHNPLGICYPPDVIKECIDWCRRRQVHLVSDEIYAGSIYRSINGGNEDKESKSFSSILKLADDNNGNCNGSTGFGPFIHWVYALSKDFALSGMRIGVCYTENEEIRLPLQKLNDLCQVSSQSQIWTEHLLTRKVAIDQSGSAGAGAGAGAGQQELWTRAFRRENHQRLRQRADALMACLEECKIPYLLPTAGLFCWIDLSAHLPASSSSSKRREEMTKLEQEADDADRERQLYLRLIHDFGLLLTPGNSMRNEEPGFFRVVFTAATNDEFALGLERIRKFAAATSMKKDY